ncbi:ctg1 protein [Gigaspora margarita]|uniref:Ctg1 protein n=1 Tax=Gigaspora margarita TaxID=4874 RepID=A0A8H4B1H5_GIGMA|nr:ctg1 protein [Gigaspora margarita]
MSFITRNVTKRNISKVLVPLNNGYNYRCYTPLGSNSSDNDPMIIEREKQRLLKGHHVGQLKNAPGWNERLASDSEAMVKAEKEPNHGSIEDLQRETLTYLLTHDTHNKHDDVVVEHYKKEVEVKQHDNTSEVSQTSEWKMDIK